MSSINQRMKNLNYLAVRITERSDNTNWDNFEGVHWAIHINGKFICEYSEGIGHFINCQHYLANKLIFKEHREAFLKDRRVDFFMSRLNMRELGGVFKKDRVSLKTLKPTQPDIKDVLYSLTMDADAVQYDFKDWCDNYGYSDDSIKAKKTFEQCRDIYAKLIGLGFTLKELQKFYEDY